MSRSIVPTYLHPCRQISDLLNLEGRLQNVRRQDLRQGVISVLTLGFVV